MVSKKYLLVIKRGNNDYLPIEWKLLKSYNNEDLNTLEGIDKFTSKHDKLSLITDIINSNMLNLDEKFQDFAIIYSEKGRNRIIKEGIIFQNKTHYTDPEYITNIIFDNIKNKQFLNNLSNLCKDSNIKVQEFKYILKNIEIFISKGNNAIKAALYKYNEIPYEIQRKLSFNILEKLLPQK